MAAHVTWSEHKQKQIEFCKIVMCQFMHVCKIAKHLLASWCSPVHMEQLGSTGQILIKFDIQACFENVSKFGLR